MNKLSSKLSLLMSFLFLSISLNTHGMNDIAGSFLADSVSKRTVITVAALAAGTFLGYKLIQWMYNSGKDYAEERIIDETADAIVISLMPHVQLNVLPQAKREEILKKKARFIMMRKRILEALKNYVADQSNELSSAHASVLQKRIAGAESVFAVIDLFRKNNPYEKDYANASVLDAMIESNLVKSIIAMAKPDAECTPQELQEKSAKRARKDKIVAKLTNKVSSIALNQLSTLPLFS